MSHFEIKSAKREKLVAPKPSTKECSESDYAKRDAILSGVEVELDQQLTSSVNKVAERVQEDLEKLILMDDDDGVRNIDDCKTKTAFSIQHCSNVCGESSSVNKKFFQIGCFSDHALETESLQSSSASFNGVLNEIELANNDLLAADDQVIGNYLKKSGESQEACKGSNDVKFVGRKQPTSSSSANEGSNLEMFTPDLESEVLNVTFVTSGCFSQLPNAGDLSVLKPCKTSTPASVCLTSELCEGGIQSSNDCIDLKDCRFICEDVGNGVQKCDSSLLDSKTVLNTNINRTMQSNVKQSSRIPTIGQSSKTRYLQFVTSQPSSLNCEPEPVAKFATYVVSNDVSFPSYAQCKINGNSVESGGLGKRNEVLVHSGCDIKRTDSAMSNNEMVVAAKIENSSRVTSETEILSHSVVSTLENANIGFNDEVSVFVNDMVTVKIRDSLRLPPVLDYNGNVASQAF